MDPHPPGRPAAPSVLLRAVNMMLDELAEKRRSANALERQLRGTRMQIDALMVPLTAALSALEPREGDGPRARLARLDAEHGARPCRLGGTPLSEAVLAYLAATEAESVTVAELQAQLARAGLAPKKRYAALALNRLHALAVVSRQRIGSYAVNRYHPELVARRMAAARALAAPAAEASGAAPPGAASP